MRTLPPPGPGASPFSCLAAGHTLARLRRVIRTATGDGADGDRSIAILRIVSEQCTIADWVT
ncbi:hypothetical protein B0H17DRAFT_1093414, partial [Mycena rosella]